LKRGGLLFSFVSFLETEHYSLVRATEEAQHYVHDHRNKNVFTSYKRIRFICSNHKDLEKLKTFWSYFGVVGSTVQRMVTCKRQQNMK